MSTQWDATVRNAIADAVETQIGTSPHLKLRTGAPPSDCAQADSGTMLVDMTLPADYFGNASAGVKSKSGTWSGAGAAAGTAGHYRVYDSGGTCRGQGTCAIGSGDMSMDNTNIAVGQVVTVNTATLTAGNA